MKRVLLEGIIDTLSSLCYDAVLLKFMTIICFLQWCMMANLQGERGIVIILNGPSSAGKTSIQKAFQKKAKRHFLRVGIDTFFDALIEEPDLSTFHQDKKLEQLTPTGELIRSIELTTDENKFPIVPLKIGPAGDRIIFGMHSAIAAYAEAGNNLIVDYILYNPAWTEDLKEKLKGEKTYFIKVHAPLEVIEQREKSRNTSPVGHARSHYNTVHKNMSYHLSIDSSIQTPEESASQILRLFD